MQIGFVIFDQITQLDFTGPLQVLSRLPEVKIHIIAKTTEPVMSDCNLGLIPTITFEECPPLDVLCIPGGFGVTEAMQDRETILFVQAQAKTAKYITSVCTGAFVLGAAGLLQGKRATTHWAYHELLALTGAVVEPARVVRDGNLFTGGGVTAGIDFALTLVAEISGEATAQAIQLGLEYDPSPPYNAGAPDLAPPQITQMLRQFYDGKSEGFEDQLRALMKDEI